MKALLTVAEALEVLFGILIILGLPKQIAAVIISPNKALYLENLAGTCLAIAFFAFLFVITRRKLNRLKTSSL